MGTSHDVKGFAIGSFLERIVIEREDRASDISRTKKQNLAGFSGANSQENRPISREKSQNSRNIRPISGDFCGRKAKICQKNWHISRDFSRKKSIFEGFSGANS